MSRATTAHLAALAALAALTAFAVARGGDVSTLAAALAGRQPDLTIVLHFRLPRILAALLTGAVLGMAGTMMQVMLRNPLASPDIIGFGAGAAAGAAIAMLTGLSAAPGAMAGGLLTAALVMALAWRDGISPLALVLIGVGLALMLATLTDVLLSLGPAIQAAEIVRFLTGSFAASTWGGVGLLAIAASIGGAAFAWLAFRVDRLEMGDDLATALGLSPDATRIAVTGIAAILVSISVAVVGPLAFVAFLAGPLARLISGQPGTCLALSAITGALIALGADALSRVALMGVTLPAGVFTAIVGGPVMLLLLINGARRRE
ncbi:iron ABC transporter permease [Palleronia sp. LCG004]|uniref:FecCD family ABC transporter permease n=1 Tax=Palleronia sp. LCG004 TaxID=3079304 RepID=UPI002943414C|nr:iron ABC transporter permease [Palleronia sp. LCG004]WOI57983.1 iron ABC transporter permease [Palleronia sp. LCG004]